MKNPLLVGLLALASLAGVMAQTPPSSGGLAAKLQPFVDDGSMAGAVMLVADKDKILDLEAVGYSDLSTKKPMTTDSFFWIASMSKAMTASALMILVDEGKLSVDDPVEKYLPEFTGQMVVDPKDPAHTPHAPSHPITIREILCHTSGLTFRTAGESGPLDTHPLAQEVANYASHPLNFDPGTQYAYSNAGINTAARIVEVVSGMPYEYFIQERLFTPLGMHETTFWPTADQLTRLAKSYVGQETPPGLQETPITQLTYPLNDRTKRFPLPAGGLFSTASEVARFCQMFLSGGTYAGRMYLSHEAIQMMTTKETSPMVSTTYGFGWQIGEEGRYSHGGAYKTYMGVDPVRGLVTVFLVQQSTRWGTPNGDNITPAFIQAAHAMAGKPAAPVEKVPTEGQGQPH